MSRSFTRSLLAAPLLATALLLSACGGDDGADQAAVATPVSTTASDAGTTPTTPTDTTPASTPDGSSDEKGSKKKNADATLSPTSEPAATQAPAPTATPDQAEAPSKLRPSAVRAQDEVLKALTAIETCWTTTSDYSECQSADQINKFGGKAVNSKAPKPTELAVTRATKASFKIVATDKSGTRWVLTKYKSGEVTRKCRRANGDVCSPSTW